MTKVMTFARHFPAFHPKAGDPIFFVEKILNSILPKLPHGGIDLDDINPEIRPLVNDFAAIDGESKHHTIRAGNNWKVGDKFSPRVWSGKPYNSPQITIAPDIEIVKVWEVEVDEDLCLWVIGGDEADGDILEKVARNDGLELQDLLSWFNKPMVGQIICWNKNIDY